MSITFNWIHLGHSATQLDPFEGNDVAEGAASFVGKSDGSAGNPLSARVTQATAIDKGGVAGAAWRGRWIRTTRPRTISSPLTLAGGGPCQDLRTAVPAIFVARSGEGLPERAL